VAGLTEGPDDCRRQPAALIDGMSATQPRRPASKSQPAPGYTLDDDSPGQATIDGLPVEPVVEVRGDGSRAESYYRHDGQLHDPDDGRPAVVGCCPDRAVEREERWRYDLRHDPLRSGAPCSLPCGKGNDRLRSERCARPLAGRPAPKRPASSAATVSRVGR